MKTGDMLIFFKAKMVVKMKVLTNISTNLCVCFLNQIPRSEELQDIAVGSKGKPALRLRQDIPV